MKKKRFKIPLTGEYILDVEIVIEKCGVDSFVINLRCMIEGMWHQVYRVDNAHGYLHEQRFWLSPEPIPLIQHTSLDYAFEFYMKQVKESFERYRSYYIQKTSLK
ncbi:MAG: hypothetical protein ISS93_02105 [Candidatus Aenigmarchaeota archaeon]|nr:hypothetical protein [Candidatus Aenigmarchaeota archaeon]